MRISTRDIDYLDLPDVVVADGLADELHGLRGPPGHRTRVRHVELRRGCNSNGNGSFELFEVKDNSCKLGPYLDFAVSGHWNISSLECKPIFEAIEEDAPSTISKIVLALHRPIEDLCRIGIQLGRRSS